MKKKVKKKHEAHVAPLNFQTNKKLINYEKSFLNRLGGAPDEEHLDAQIRRLDTRRTRRARIDKVRRSVPNAEVPQPVRRSRHRHALRADSEREYLPRDDPRDGPPRRREERDVEAHEGDEHALRGEVHLGGGAGGFAGCHAYDGDYELAEAHPDGADEEEAPAADAVD